MFCWMRYFRAHRYWRKADRLWNTGDRKLAMMWYTKAIITNPDLDEVNEWCILTRIKCMELEYGIEP